LAVFCLILRRYAQNLVPASCSQFAQQQVGGGNPAGSSFVDHSAGVQELPPEIGGLHLERPAFDVSAVASLRSTWAEELQKKEEVETQAIFQHLFKQNMELRARVSATGEVS